MEACGSAHYWARELIAMGHEVVLIPPAYIKPYVKRGKKTRSMRRRSARRCRGQACALCRSRARISRPLLMLHKTRELLVKQRTMSVNALRGHLAEFGIVAAKGH